MPPTPQLSWPLLNQRAGCELWVKHENHTATGAFKIRGGIVLLDALKRANPALPGVISATRGNHGQSLAWSGRRHGVRTVIVVPHGNSRDKNAAMRAWGAELIEHGRDYDEARQHAAKLAQDQGSNPSARSTSNSLPAWAATRSSCSLRWRSWTRYTCRSAAARGSAA